MAWKKIESTSTNSYGKGAYVSLKPGESRIGVFVGDPLIYRNHYSLGNCTETPDCPHCKAGSKSSMRFDANFVCIENGIWVCKVLSSGKTLFNNICNLAEDSYDISTYKMKLTKMNDEKNPWAIVPVPRGELTADEAHLVSKVEWKVKVESKSSTDKSGAPLGIDDDIGF